MLEYSSPILVFSLFIFFQIRNAAVCFVQAFWRPPTTSGWKCFEQAAEQIRGQLTASTLTSTDLLSPPLPAEVHPAAASFRKQLLWWKEKKKASKPKGQGSMCWWIMGLRCACLLLTGFIGREDELVTLYIIIVLRPVCPLASLELVQRINAEIISEMNS